MPSITITLSIEAHARLKKLKGPGDSFSDVIVRELPNPCLTAGELLDRMESIEVPKADPKLRAAMLGGRGASLTTGSAKVICDTTFLSDIHSERQSHQRGPALTFLARHRSHAILVTVISVGELAVIFPEPDEARRFLANYRVLRLTPEVAFVAAAIDRELIQIGERLGENDNWIAGFCRYYGQPVISRDSAFDRVRGLRRLVY